MFHVFHQYLKIVGVDLPIKSRERKTSGTSVYVDRPAFSAHVSCLIKSIHLCVFVFRKQERGGACDWKLFEQSINPRRKINQWRPADIAAAEKSIRRVAT